MLIYSNLADYIKKRVSEFGDFDINPSSTKGTHHKNRYVKVNIKGHDYSVHYEYKSHAPSPCVELHFEDEFARRNKEHIREIYEKTRTHAGLEWRRWYGLEYGACRLKKNLSNESDIIEGFKELHEIFKEYLEKLNELAHYEALPKEKFEKFESLTQADSKDEVVILKKGIEDIFKCDLIIPAYQRIYCWEASNISSLWEEIASIHSEYHLGNIILHERKGDQGVEYHIIDGQQRLVTLSLILLELRYSGQMPLIYQKFRSTLAQNYVAKAKYTISNIVTNSSYTNPLENIIEHVKFSVLVLKTDNLDLAYTFFSNQNSKGIPLSDFDLLKAHHLRYLSTETQAEHLAKRWNDLSLNHESDLKATLQKHLYRLRKWNRKQPCEEWKARYTKEEFSAALVMDSIPAFGESFQFKEKIQGGAHFFAYAETFTSRYKEFCSLKQIILLREQLQHESHWKYADIMESLLFLYYIKFGRLYFSEALYCISSTIAQHRYSTKRALMHKINEYAKESEIVMMIEDASSPTFFIAESLSKIKITRLNIDNSGGIEYRFYDQLCAVWRALDDVTEIKIQQFIDNV